MPNIKTKDRTMKIVECPHCFKKGGISIMKRYHFDKCKLNSKTWDENEKYILLQKLINENKRLRKKVQKGEEFFVILINWPRDIDLNLCFEGYKKNWRKLMK
jgi:hypothetical protein